MGDGNRVGLVRREVLGVVRSVGAGVLDEVTRLGGGLVGGSSPSRDRLFG